MKTRKIHVLLVISLCLMAWVSTAYARDEVGSVVAVRGKAMIERDKKTSEAKVKDGLYLQDIVATGEASRAKLLFIDESVLTLGEKSKAGIREFIYSKDQAGKSIFNLIDGKMRTVVGKAGFEVHTPTAVAAARGTVILFETGINKDGKMFTTIICLEGAVEIMLLPPAQGSIILTPGMMITIVEGQPMPVPVEATEADKERLLNDTDIFGDEISIPGPLQIGIGVGFMTIEGMRQGTTWNQPLQPTTPVNINLLFPK